MNLQSLIGAGERENTKPNGSRFNGVKRAASGGIGNWLLHDCGDAVTQVLTEQRGQSNVQNENGDLGMSVVRSQWSVALGQADNADDKVTCRKGDKVRSCGRPGSRGTAGRGVGVRNRRDGVPSYMA
jgi:hypothetical protein